MYKILPKTLFIGKSFHYLPTCHSTNDISNDLITENPQVMDGTVVLSFDQTAGKGQRGNKWESQSGKNLTFSIIVSPAFLKIQQQFNLNIIVCLALQDLLKPLIGEGLKIKWPNDIYFNNKKICGILIQNIIKGQQIEKSIIGIGLNVNQELFEDSKALSLKSITGKEFNLLELLEGLLEKVESRYLLMKNQEFKFLHNEYIETLYWKGESHTFKADAVFFEGNIIGVDEIGRLRMEVDSKMEVFNFKEIEFIC